MVHLVELSACVAPACNLDQRRLAIGRGWSVEPFEPAYPSACRKPRQVPSSASAWMPRPFAE